MSKRRLPKVLTVATMASVGCTPASHEDAGVDGGRPVIVNTDSGVPDAGPRDAGTHDAGCPVNCARSDGGCALPADFPEGMPGFVMQEICSCQGSRYFFCYDETALRCDEWDCFPMKDLDGGAPVLMPDGGPQCLC